MNYQRNLNKRAIAKRVILIWIIALLAGGIIGFCIGYCM